MPADNYFKVTTYRDPLDHEPMRKVIDQQMFFCFDSKDARAVDEAWDQACTFALRIDRRRDRDGITDPARLISIWIPLTRSGAWDEVCNKRQISPWLYLPLRRSRVDTSTN